MHTRFAALLLALGLADVGYLNLGVGPDVFVVADDGHNAEPSTARAALREGERHPPPAHDDRGTAPPASGASPRATSALAPEPAPEPAPELQPAPTERLAPAVTERAPQLAPAELVVSFPGTATATLTEEALAELQALAAHLREHPNQHLRVVGHADARGPRGFNRYLGIRRARAVTEVLLSAGVARRQIEALSRGEDDPRVTGESETAWAANRRVEISVGSERRNGS